MAQLEHMLLSADPLASARPARPARLTTQAVPSSTRRARRDGLAAGSAARRRWLAPGLLVCGLTAAVMMPLFIAQDPCVIGASELEQPALALMLPAPWMQPAQRPAQRPASALAPKPAPALAPKPEAPGNCRQALSAWRRDLAPGLLLRCGQRDEVSSGERIDVSLTLDSTGQTRMAQLRPSYYENDRFGLCVRRALLDLKFPECADRGRRTVTWQLVYLDREAP